MWNLTKMLLILGSMPCRNVHHRFELKLIGFCASQIKAFWVLFYEIRKYFTKITKVSLVLPPNHKKLCLLIQFSGMVWFWKSEISWPTECLVINILKLTLILIPFFEAFERANFWENISNCRFVWFLGPWYVEVCEKSNINSRHLFWSR